MKEDIIKLREGRLGVLKPGHPWIYKAQLKKSYTEARPGSIVRVENAQGVFIGRGYFNPKSEIAVRLLTFHDERIDVPFIRKRFEAALGKRCRVKETTDAYRAIYSEADALPGLIVDIYGDTAVFQVLTLGMEKMKELIVDMVEQTISPKYLYEKSVSPFRKLEGLRDQARWWTEKRAMPVEIREGKARFLVNVERSHKTGFYLDQRKPRMSLEHIVKGKRVLDLFCYTGGFSISAALSGASEVRGVDIKKEWLALAKENAVLNGVAEKTTFAHGDAFDVLRAYNRAGQTFDVVILDPPSFVKSARELRDAARGYKELNLTAMKVLNNGGTLATFSCSHHMRNELFADIVKKSAHDAKKKFTILKRCHQAEDHPIVTSIPETEYLKGYFLRVTT